MHVDAHFLPMGNGNGAVFRIGDADMGAMQGGVKAFDGDGTVAMCNRERSGVKGREVVISHQPETDRVLCGQLTIQPVMLVLGVL